MNLAIQGSAAKPFYMPKVFVKKLYKSWNWLAKSPLNTEIVYQKVLCDEEEL